MQKIEKEPLPIISHFLKMIGVVFAVILFNAFLFIPPAVLAANNSSENFSSEIEKSKNTYRPFIEIGGAKYFHQSSTAALVYDFFIPLFQKDNQLLFTDLRIFDRSGSQFEGNAHFGYRRMNETTKQMFGIYGAFDRKRTVEQNWFNQLTLGLEYWHNRFFIGGNAYKPIGSTKKLTKITQNIGPQELNIREITTKTQITTTREYEKSLGGIDAELGYEITDSLTSYVGGYYFSANDVKTVTGPKIRLTYDYTKPTGRVLGIFDGVSIETGAQYDKPRRFSGYIGIKLKIGLTDPDNTSNPAGFAKHMVELVRRDQDIVHESVNTPDTHIVVKTATITMLDIAFHYKINEYLTSDALSDFLAKIYSELTEPSQYPDITTANIANNFYTTLIYKMAEQIDTTCSLVVKTFGAIITRLTKWDEIKHIIVPLSNFGKLSTQQQNIIAKNIAEHPSISKESVTPKTIYNIEEQVDTTHSLAVRTGSAIIAKSGTLDETQCAVETLPNFGEFSPEQQYMIADGIIKSQALQDPTTVKEFRRKMARLHHPDKHSNQPEEQQKIHEKSFIEWNTIIATVIKRNNSNAPTTQPSPSQPKDDRKQRQDTTQTEHFANTALVTYSTTDSQQPAMPLYEHYTFTKPSSQTPEITPPVQQRACIEGICKPFNNQPLIPEQKPATEKPQTPPKKQR